MDSMRDEFKKFFGDDLDKQEIIGEYKCECGRDVQEVTAPVLGGPNKGRLITVKRHCICSDNAEAREAKERHERRLHSD